MPNKDSSAVDQDFYIHHGSAGGKDFQPTGQTSYSPPISPPISPRDYFAGQALAGLLAGARHHFPIGAPSKQIAAAADDLADAMIAARDA